MAAVVPPMVAAVDTVPQGGEDTVEAIAREAPAIAHTRLCFVWSL